MRSLLNQVPVRSVADIDKMRLAGRVVAEMHEATRAALRPGVTTNDLDRIARDVLDRRGATSNFLGYHGYPAVICASPNDVVVHGIPNDVPLDEGDIVSIDCGAIIDGWHGDAAYSAGVGAVDAADQRLMDTARACLDAAIAVMAPDHRMGDIGDAVQRTAEAAGFTIAANFSGHGIGRAMHEYPNVPNVGRAGKGMRLQSGWVFAIEPMLTAGSAHTHDLDDGWTAVTTDGSRAAHWEHTIAITDNGPEILTL